MDKQAVQQKSQTDKLSAPRTPKPLQKTEFNIAPTHFSVWRLLIIMMIGIFLAEMVGMFIPFSSNGISTYVQTLIHACILTGMVFPIIYYFSIRPLITQIEKRRQIENALLKSEERFNKAFHLSPAALAITRVSDGEFIDVNESFLKIYGVQREDLIGQTSVGLGMFLDPNEREILKQKTVKNQSLLEEGVRNYEFESLVNSGEIRTIQISTEGIDLDGMPCILSIISDITESKRTEEHLRRINRALSVLNKCNQILVYAEDENALMQEMCDAIVSVGEHLMAWVGFAEQDEAKSVRPVTQAGFANDYLNTAQISWGDNERGRGPTGCAVREGVVKVNHDTSSAPNMGPWRASALTQGYRSSIALPLTNEGTVFGALTIYSALADAFDEEEIRLLTELANDLAFGITTLRLRAEHEKAQEQIRQMALFPALNPDAVIRVDSNGRIERTNPAANEMGFRVDAQLTDNAPDLSAIDLHGCIAAGNEIHIQQEARLGEKVFLWSVRGVPEIGLAFLYGKDITERKQNETAIRQLSSIVEQTADSVVITNRSGVIEYVNPAFERLTGYSASETIGGTPRLLKSGVHDKLFYKDLWETVLAGGIFQSELANRKKNGELFYEVKTITPIRDSRGEITHFAATGKDITEHKRDEEKLRKAYDELELRIQERTEELRIAISQLEEEIIQHKQTESALSESERRLSRAQEIAHLGSWELDLLENHLIWSDEVYRIFGLKPQEFAATYEAFLDAIHPDDRAAVDSAYSSSLRDGRDSYEIEHRVIRRTTGEIRFVHEKCEHFRNETGEIIRSVGMVHDITDRKQAEDALHRYELLSKNSRDIILFVRQKDGCILEANTAAEEAYGYSHKELVALTIQDLRSKNTQNLTAKQMAQAESGGILFETIHVRKDGNTFPVEVSSQGVTIGGVRTLISIIRDITERKQAEKQLERSNQKLNEILASIQDDFYVIDRNWNFVYTSHLFTSKVGKKPEDFIGNNIWEMFPMHKGTTFEENFRIAMEKREVRRFEIGGKYTSAWYRMTAFPSAEGITVIGTDVTERKKAEDALQKAHDELELRVQERTQELAVANQGLLVEINERKEVERQLRVLTTAIKAAANGIILTDTQGVIQWINSAVTQMSGYEGYELVGQNMRVLKSGLQDAAFYEQMWNAIISGEVWRGEVINRRKNGTLYVEEQTITPVRDDTGSITLFVAVKEDITQHKQMEAALETERIRLKNILDTIPDGVYIVNKDFDIEYINPVIEKEFGLRSDRKCFNYFHLQQKPCSWCNNDTVLAGKSMAGEQQYAINKKIYELFEAPLTNQDGSTSKLKLLHDITNRKQAEMELERRNRELQAMTAAEQEQRQLAEALAKAAITLNTSLKLDDVLTHILEQINGVIPYQLADVMLLEGEAFYDASHAGELNWPDHLSGTANRFPLSSFPLFKKLTKTRQPALIEDTRKESEWGAVKGFEWSLSFLSAPLLVEGNVIGFVNLFAKQPGFFTQKMCEQLVAFAAHAAVAIQNAWLFEQVRSSSDRLHSLSRRLVEIQENERRYISRELHDEAGQLLTSMMVDLRLLEKKVAEPEIVKRKIPELENALNQVLENLHRVAMALRPASLDHLGLVAAIKQHLETIAEKNNLRINFKAGKIQKRLPANVETVLYRIVQEALTNVVRHAHASQVDIVLTERDEKTVIIVEDDGIGFDPESAMTGSHLGLFGIRERVEMIDGKLTIESAPRKGTTLIVEVDHANTIAGRR